MIDEAIEYAMKMARSDDQRAKDYAQLADWLSELRLARMKIDLLKALRDGWRADAQKYKDENAKLRACLGDGCADCAVGMGEYADSLCDPLKVENAKLRELVARIWNTARLMDANSQIDGMRITDDFRVECEETFEELGIEV